MEVITKKNKKAQVKPYMVKNHLRVFVSARINNPTFDSQVRRPASSTGDSNRLLVIAWDLPSSCIPSPQTLSTSASHAEQLRRYILVLKCCRAGFLLTSSANLCTTCLRPPMLHGCVIRTDLCLSSPLRQTKDTLTLKVSSFGSKCELEDALLKKIAACGVVDLVTSFAKSKEERGLKKGDGAKRSRLVGARPFLAES